MPIQLTLLDRESKKIAERTTGYPSWLLGSERVQEVIPVEGKPGTCQYRTYHTVEGVAAYYILLTSQEDLTDSLRCSADNRKLYVESRKRDLRTRRTV